MTKTIDGREVIVAIIGGTMLTLALTRPQLRWMANMPRSSKSQRLWAERALTGFSLVMGGYAMASVWIALYGQLGKETDALIRGAAGFLVIYAGLVHFEPFVNEWRLRTGSGALFLYTGFASLAVSVGWVIADLVLTPSVGPSGIRLLALTSGTTGVGWVVYRFGSDLMAALERPIDRAIERRRALQRPDAEDRKPA